MDTDQGRSRGRRLPCALDRSVRFEPHDHRRRSRRDDQRRHRRDVELLVQPADRAVLSRGGGQRISLSHLRSAAGQRHRWHHESRQLRCDHTERLGNRWRRRERLHRSGSRRPERRVRRQHEWRSVPVRARHGSVARDRSARRGGLRRKPPRCHLSLHVDVSGCLLRHETARDLLRVAIRPEEHRSRAELDADQRGSFTPRRRRHDGSFRWRDGAEAGPGRSARRGLYDRAVHAAPRPDLGGDGRWADPCVAG